MNDNNQNRNSNKPFWALLLITGLPFIAALYLFYHPELVESFKTSNKGTLIDPPRPVASLQLQTLDGAGFNTAGLKDFWSLITVAPSNCDQTCLQNVYHLRQVRLAQGENRKRIHRILLLEDDQHLSDLPGKLKDFEGTIVVTGPAAARDTLLKQLSPAGEAVTGRFYLVDPQGNLMMRYGQNPNPKDVLKDLEHLLKVMQL